MPGTPEPTVSYLVVDTESTTAEFRSCVEVEVAVLGSPSLISLMVSVDVNTMKKKEEEVLVTRAQELCESRGGRRGGRS